MAIGIALPYGGYYVVDKFFNIKYFDVTVHTGVATKLITYHTYAGSDLGLNITTEQSFFNHRLVSRVQLTSFLMVQKQPCRMSAAALVIVPGLKTTNYWFWRI
jgi:hypothetical protein